MPALHTEIHIRLKLLPISVICILQSEHYIAIVKIICVFSMLCEFFSVNKEHNKIFSKGRSKSRRVENHCSQLVITSVLRGSVAEWSDRQTWIKILVLP